MGSILPPLSPVYIYVYICYRVLPAYGNGMSGKSFWGDCIIRVQSHHKISHSKEGYPFTATDCRAAMKLQEPCKRDSGVTLLNMDIHKYVLCRNLFYAVLSANIQHRQFHHLLWIILYVYILQLLVYIHPV